MIPQLVHRYQPPKLDDLGSAERFYIPCYLWRSIGDSLELKWNLLKILYVSGKLNQVHCATRTSYFNPDFTNWTLIFIHYYYYWKKGKKNNELEGKLRDRDVYVTIKDFWLKSLYESQNKFLLSLVKMSVHFVNLRLR